MSSAIPDTTHEAGTPRDILSPARFTAIVLRQRRLVAAIPAVAVVLVAAFTLIPPRTYSATVAFTPVASASALSSLLGVAEQIGVNLPGEQPQTSPAFYSDLVTTEGFLRELAQTRFRFNADGNEVDASLIDIYEIDKGTAEKTLYEAVRFLREEAITTTPNRLTGVVAVTVQTEWPELSELIVRKLLDQVNTFNLASRTIQAGAERTFLDQRLELARTEMRTAEDALQQFLQNNRDFRNDPRLQFQYDRLQREIALRAQVYATLTQAFEQARVEAVRNTPSITVVEAPKRPLRPDNRHVVLKILLTGFLGTLAGIALALARDYATAARTEEPGELRALDSEWAATRADISRLLARVGIKSRRAAG